jgi:hypothetical protein
VLWIDEGTKPELTSPALNRWAMGQTLVRDARKHFGFFREHTDGFGVRVDPATGKLIPMVWGGTPLPAADTLLCPVPLQTCTTT